jgi:hypothetical protein
MVVGVNDTTNPALGKTESVRFTVPVNPLMADRLRVDEPVESGAK